MPSDDTIINQVLVTCAGTEQARLTAHIDTVGLWMVLADGPLAATDPSNEHPLAGGRPVADTDSDDPLTRWEVEQVAQELAARQAARRTEQDDAARAILERLVTKAQTDHQAGRDSEHVTVAVSAGEPELLLEWLNRQYVRLRTSDSHDAAAKVGAGQSAAMFLGMTDEDDDDPIVVDTHEQRLTLAVAYMVSLHVQELTRQLFLS